jgi:hypothetical protein
MLRILQSAPDAQACLKRREAGACCRKIDEIQISIAPNRKKRKQAR